MPPDPPPHIGGAGDVPPRGSYNRRVEDAYAQVTRQMVENMAEDIADLRKSAADIRTDLNAKIDRIIMLMLGAFVTVACSAIGGLIVYAVTHVKLGGN